MKIIYPKFAEADIIVIATPVYVFGMTGPMKNLLDRLLIPGAQPFIVLRDGHTHHPARGEAKQEYSR